MPGLEEIPILIEEGIDILGSIGIGGSSETFLPPLFRTMPEKEAIDKITKQKVKVKDDTDGKRVVRGSDVAKCIEDYFNSGTQGLQLLKSLVSVITSAPGKGITTTQAGATAIMSCVRKKYLRQDKPEIKKIGPHRSRK